MCALPHHDQVIQQSPYRNTQQTVECLEYITGLCCHGSKIQYVYRQFSFLLICNFKMAHLQALCTVTQYNASTVVVVQYVRVALCIMVQSHIQLVCHVPSTCVTQLGSRCGIC